MILKEQYSKERRVKVHRKREGLRALGGIREDSSRDGISHHTPL